MTPTRVAVPRAIKTEHHELLHALTRAVEAGGRTGEAASRVVDLMHPHLVKEEEFCLPPLSALASLAKGELVPNAASLLAMTEKLRTEFGTLVREHDEIVRALQLLIVTAKADRRTEVVEFAEKLVLHAEMEEDVLYPAALLVGEILKARRAP
jgi:hemerythrin-like domain-containing protein